MAVQRLILDSLEDENFELIAIHCSLAPYRLAYLINKHLDIKLARTSKDVLFDFKDTTASFQRYTYYDEFSDVTFDLITNIHKSEAEISTGNTSNLFEEDSKKMFVKQLIPEYKSVDFFIKVTSESDQFLAKSLLSKLQNITQIITAYSIDKSGLKSKNNLIFE
ncbi:IPExxxVDY family protein [Aquimarina brevivitae]|uniref:IPExxxVDY family protein n=1 Tax=Aquimarina brevivitae TaxID=323412 RepID=A0A4Q7PI94_9FLAO|nr:IPExxxVDY family protein [Aquimarina brevivitae]RZS99540.1 hypothetical protein EV197_0762 [Aquimarina brevivitae]